ncbi:class I SAM-dependent methyltransferase [Phenylobacterium sp.]|jgi:SAM-dependent methyltransferase|uniref:class I SAM-dependent methyltransferase n=1 Tax=Phenylobacterium sp. TaxID=1871053 RepID=UPI0035B1CC40
MTASPPAATYSAAYWNQTGGQAWVELQGLMDGLNKSIEDVLVEAAFPGAGKAVVDVGCGAGATTLAMARRLGVGGESLGVDVSEALLDLARGRSEHEGLEGARFAVGDAQSLDMGEHRFDAAMSRFGVMFFSDFDAAFANIRRSVKPGGKLAFACWRRPADNPLAGAPMKAVAHLLPPQPTPDPDAPGRFAFADAARVRGILERSGWSDIAVEPLDAPTPISLEDLTTLSLRMGPLANALREQDEATGAKVREAVVRALEPYVEDGIIPMVAGCWLVTARA